MARKNRARIVGGANEKWCAQRHGSGGRAMRAGASRIEKMAETRARRDGEREIEEQLEAAHEAEAERIKVSAEEAFALMARRDEIARLWKDYDALGAAESAAIVGSVGMREVQSLREQILDWICGD